MNIIIIFFFCKEVVAGKRHFYLNGDFVPGYETSSADEELINHVKIYSKNNVLKSRGRPLFLNNSNDNFFSNQLEDGHIIHKQDSCSHAKN